MQRISNYLWPSSPSSPPLSVEAQQKREKIHTALSYSQYAILIYAGYLLLAEGRIFSSIATAAVGTYLEKIAASFYEKLMQDPETAKFITDRYSTISQFSTFFNPAVQPALAKAIDILSVPKPKS